MRFINWLIRNGYYVEKIKEETTSGDVAKSGQTRIVGARNNHIHVMKREPVPIEFDPETGMYRPANQIKKKKKRKKTIIKKKKT